MRFAALVTSVLPLLSVCKVDYHDVTNRKDPLPAEVRKQWMQVAIDALSDLKSTPCPFEAFGASIVNHTASLAGELVCIGANSIAAEGNPTLHGMLLSDNPILMSTWN